MREITLRPAKKEDPPFISQIMERMVVYSEGNRHDIDHFMKVYAFAKTIGELEGLDGETQFILEAAAIVHDIACPLCRAKYGNTNGKLQEQEGGPLAREFFAGCDLTETQVERIVWLVGHHHTVDPVEGIDHRILLEADYLVNAEESGYSRENIANTKRVLFRTGAGTRLLESMYGV